MNIDTIVARIAEESREQAAGQLDAARARAQDIERGTGEEIEAQRKQAAIDAKDEAALLRERMLRMASLEDKKETLVMKREVVDQAFDKALARMNAMPAEEARALSQSLILADAQGDEEILFGAGDEAVYDDAFLSQANAALVQAGKQGSLSYGKDRLPQKGGFVLRRGGMQMEMTWEMLLKARRDTLEADVANLLFAN